MSFSTGLPSPLAARLRSLTAWQPILTPRTVLPAFFVLGICFIPIGIVLFFASNGVCEPCLGKGGAVYAWPVSRSVPPALRTNVVAL